MGHKTYKALQTPKKGPVLRGEVGNNRQYHLVIRSALKEARLHKDLGRRRLMY